MALLDWDENHPQPTEYNDFYGKYIDLVTTPNVVQQLIQQGQNTYAFIRQLNPEQASYRYEEGKWNVKEVIGHLIDTERVMAYRALSIARGEERSLPGFNQDDYVSEANFSERSLQNLSAEYDAQRNANVSLFSSFDPDHISQVGTANGSEVSIRALAYIIAGHEQHHLGVLKEKYEISF